MTTPDLGAGARLQARIAGLLYVGTFAGGITDILVSDRMIVRADAAATTHNILAAEPLWRVGFAGEMVGMLCYIGVTALLYRVLRPAGRTLSLTAAAFSLAGCAIGAIAAACLMAPFFYVGDQAQPYMAAFTPAQLEAMAMVAIRMHGTVYNVAMLCFGCYCALLGVLVFRSGFIPRMLGVLLMITGASDLIHTFAIFLDPALGRALDPYAMLPGFLGEGGICLWLTFVGLNAPKWQSRFEGSLAAA